MYVDKSGNEKEDVIKEENENDSNENDENDGDHVNEEDDDEDEDLMRLSYVMSPQLNVGTLHTLWSDCSRRSVRAFLE